MRILHISSAQSLGGGERHFADLTNALAARGHDVYAALRPQSPLAAKLSRLPASNVMTLPLRNALDAQSARDLKRFITEHDIEIVHAHLARDYPIAAYATRRVSSASLIVTRHVLFPLNRLHQITLLRAARIIAVSQAVALQLRSQRIVPPERITVVLNGIDVDRFAKAREQFNRPEFLRSWGLPDEGFLVGTVGELKALKGHEEFVRAAKQVLYEFKNAYFIIAGVDASPNGENRTVLNSLIERLNLVDHVRIVGALEDIAPLLCSLDVFVSASRMESFGLAIAEAMACSLAVVATETAGAREILGQGETGLLVPVGDAEALASAVRALLNDEDKRRSLGNDARKAVSEHFSLDRMVETTEGIYRESMTRSRRMAV